MRLSEAELAQLLARGEVRVVAGDRGRPGADTPSSTARPHLSEAAWMATVRRLAKDAGYTYQYHVFDSRRTVYGYPDLTLVHRDPGHKLLMVELKTDTGQVTAAQQAWLEALTGSTGVVAEVWRPAQLEEICRVLRT